MATETVLGVFAHVDTTVRALEELRARGYHDLTVYTPLPVHEIEEVLERDRPVSRVRLFTLIGGLAGIASAFLLTIWSSMVWGQVTGGKYLVPAGSGMSGSRAVASRATNAASSASAIPPRASVRVEPQPWSSAPTIV